MADTILNMRLRDMALATNYEIDKVRALIPNALASVPPGGTSGQVLSKISASDYATGWVNPGGVADGDKGDVIVSGGGTVWSLDPATTATFAPAVHTHVIADVTGLTAALAGKAATGLATASGATATTAKLLGRASAGTGALEEITLGTNLSFTGTTLNATVSGGIGTVTTVSVVTANGVSGTVATASTTPAITLALGAITPTSVAATGTVTGSNLSGTNTGDQTSVTGNAGTATALQTARTINGVAFDGTANITVNAVDATARVPATRSIATTAPLAGGGALSADLTLTISAATGAAPGTMSAADFTKLAGVASGATANSSDATLLNRANHTGTQAVGTITGNWPVAQLNGGTGASASTFWRGDGTWAAATSSGLTLTTVEINLGYPAKRSGKFTIAGTGLTVGKTVRIFQSVGPYTNKGTRADEAEMESVSVTASVTSATTITAYWRNRSRVGGNIKFDYFIGA